MADEIKEGRGAYNFLQVFAVLNALAAAIIAIVLISNSKQTDASFDILGNLTTDESTDPTIVAAAVVVAAEGLLVSVGAWALASIGHHVLSIRNDLRSPTVAAAADGRTTLMTLPGPPTTQHPAWTLPEGFVVESESPTWVLGRTRAGAYATISKLNGAMETWPNTEDARSAFTSRTEADAT